MSQAGGAETVNACAMLLQDRTSQARKYLEAALTACADAQTYLPSLIGVAAAALLLAKMEQPVRAIELYASVRKHAFVTNSIWFADVFGRRLRKITETISPSEVEAAQARGRARDLRETITDLLN